MNNENLNNEPKEGNNIFQNISSENKPSESIELKVIDINKPEDNSDSQKDDNIDDNIDILNKNTSKKEQNISNNILEIKEEENDIKNQKDLKNIEEQNKLV